jgi:hypothetical protein
MNFLSGSQILRVAKWLGISVLSLVFALCVIVIVAGITAPNQRTALTAGGERQDVSFYLRMPDGVHLAVDVWLPSGYNGGKIPTLVTMTRYWREQKLSFLGRAVFHLGLLPEIAREGAAVPFQAYFLEANFAVVTVDSRGTGASEGKWIIPFGAPKEISDFNTVFNWIVKQPWSNGRIGTFGISYPGFTAELAASNHNPALRAVAPLFVYWDVTRDAVEPGGIRDNWLINIWSSFTTGLDHNNECAIGGFKCKVSSLLFEGVKPVDSDPNGRLLARIIETRGNESFADGMKAYEFRGDKYTGTNLSLDDVDPSARAARLSDSGVPYYVMAGWYDSDGATSVLRRYLDQSNSQDVLIGSWTHGGQHNTDPYLPSGSPAPMSLDEVSQRLIAFFNKHLRSDAMPANSGVRRISYYVNGAHFWRTTTSWPPKGYLMHRWYLSNGHSLKSAAPSSSTGADKYVVNFGATSGPEPRYHTTLGGAPVLYANRNVEDRLLLSYTSPVIRSDMELTGTPAVELQMTSTSSDGGVYVYLEDVAPSGHITYLTEGKLRLIDRAVADPQHLLGALGPQHSFLRDDAKPMPLGKPTTVDVALQPISAVIRRGHSLRISIAGYDASGFQRVPTNGDPTFVIERNRNALSYIDLPTAAFNASGGIARPPLP